MESRIINIHILGPWDLPEQDVSDWVKRKTRDSSMILVQFWKTAEDAHHLQDAFFNDPDDGKDFCPVRITTAGLDELSMDRSSSASSIISFRALGGQENHTLNIMHPYRARRDERNNVSLVWSWKEAEHTLSVQEAVYAFEGRTVTVLACREKSQRNYPDVLEMVLNYCHVLSGENVLVMYGLQGLSLEKLDSWSLKAQQLPSGGLVLYHKAAQQPPTIEDGMVSLRCKKFEVSNRPHTPGAVIFTFNIQSPYTHELQVLGGEEKETLKLNDYSYDKRIRPYVEHNSQLLAGYIARQTLAALSQCSRVVWAIQEASDEFVLAMQMEAQALGIPLRLYSQPAERDDCILISSRERGVEMVATLDIGLDDTRAATEFYERSKQPPVMTLSMLRKELIVHLAACHLMVPDERRGRSQRTTVVQDVLSCWHLPPQPKEKLTNPEIYAEAILVLGDFNLKGQFWWNRYNEDQTFLEKAHGTARFKERLWVSLWSGHLLDDETESDLSSPNDHIFVYEREGEESVLEVKDVTRRYRAEFKKTKGVTPDVLLELSRAFFPSPDERSLDDSEVLSWPISDHEPLAVSIVNKAFSASFLEDALTSRLKKTES